MKRNPQIISFILKKSIYVINYVFNYAINHVYLCNQLLSLYGLYQEYIFYIITLRLFYINSTNIEVFRVKTSK